MNARTHGVLVVCTLLLSGQSGLAAQDGRQRTQHQIGPVVPLAQVCRHDPAQPGSPEALQQCRGCSIGQVPQPSRDASLERRWIRAVGKQSRIMVAFEQEPVASGEHPFHVGRRLPDVGENAQAQRPVGRTVLDGLPGIVGHRKRLHLQVAEGARLVAVDDGRLDTPGLGLACHHGSVGEEDPVTVSPRAGPGTGDVVRMLVGDPDRGDVRWCEP